VVEMQAAWSRPVAEVVVFSNDVASRRARPSRPWVSTTTVVGVAWVRASASRAASCRTVRTRAQVPLRDHRRNRDHTRVQGPDDSEQEPPLATGVGDVEHRVHHPPQVRRVLGSSLARGVGHRIQQRRLLVGQVTGVRHAVHGVDRPC
jgi:hypothetical protein